MSRPQLRTVAHVIEVESKDSEGRTVGYRVQIGADQISIWPLDTANAPAAVLTYSQLYFAGIKQAARDER